MVLASLILLMVDAFFRLYFLTPIKPLLLQSIISHMLAMNFDHVRISIDILKKWETFTVTGMKVERNGRSNETWFCLFAGTSFIGGNFAGSGLCCRLLSPERRRQQQGEEIILLEEEQLESS